MEPSPHKWMGLLAGVALLTGGGSSSLLDPNPAQAKQEGPVRMAAQTPGVYDFTLNDIDGKPVSLSQFRGKVLLLVNTASFCGNTPQYADLEKMYEQYREKGFEILAFPANNFGKQEPGTDAEIKTFCYTKYSLSFPLFSKISVKGNDTHPLYRYLTEQSPFPGEVEWNFQKYLVDRSGAVVARYPHRTKPLAPEIVQDLERLLAAR
ncbi:MAG: redoxin domain-containing protein [Nitrospira sp.]|nr:redoxin domain-containing protein [Nitrospira sp.]